MLVYKILWFGSEEEYNSNSPTETEMMEAKGSIDEHIDKFQERVFLQDWYKCDVFKCLRKPKRIKDEQLILSIDENGVEMV